MPLKIEPTSFEMPDDKMTYGDFVIRFEHKFIRNIYTSEQIKQSDYLKCLENYYKAYQKFISISIGFLSMFNNYNRNYEINVETSEFIEESFANDIIDELKTWVMQAEIKNALKTSFGKVPKFNLKIYAFVYDWLIYFPKSGRQYESFTTGSFFVNTHHLIKMKVHLHHSRITGRIIGYGHDFCNARGRENNMEIPVIAHNLFGFDLHYFIKGFIASAWCSKELNINFSKVIGEVKFIDSLKYYQKSLAELARTLTEEGKGAIKNLTEQFFNQHHFFSNIWVLLNSEKKKKGLEVVSEGKDIIPYELIIGMESFFLMPEKNFWEKTDFFSDLKQSTVSDENYEHSKYLYHTLKMRNLGDMNDLYNAQDVILLCEIIKSRFQMMNDKYGFNPRKCNSASSMSSCIEIEMSRVILALPTKLDHVEIFQQTVTGGFSSVNTRVAFDTQILLPNLDDKTNVENNPLNKDFHCKVAYNLAVF